MPTQPTPKASPPDQHSQPDQHGVHLPRPDGAEELSQEEAGKDPLLLIDAANVVGSVPDGWWHDRAGAAERLREALRPLGGTGLPGHPPPLEVVLVVEGAARQVGPAPGVRVVPARGSGDDAIVDLLEREGGGGRDTVVVTADRGLRQRVTQLGATVYGPSVLPRWSTGSTGRRHR